MPDPIDLGVDLDGFDDGEPPRPPAPAQPIPTDLPDGGSTIPLADLQAAGFLIRDMATGNAGEWLAARGFKPGRGGPGTFRVGWLIDPDVDEALGDA